MIGQNDAQDRSMAVQLIACDALGRTITQDGLNNSIAAIVGGAGPAWMSGLLNSAEAVAWRAKVSGTKSAGLKKVVPYEDELAAWVATLPKSKRVKPAPKMTR